MSVSAPLDEAHSALACHGVTVRYGDVVALRDVSVAFEPGQIHAVVGQNGAGKTTFARVCAGIIQPAHGTVRIGGRTVPARRVTAARRLGVELVHQNFALPPSFTVAEALEFGSVARTAPVYHRRGLEARWRAHLESLDVRARLSDRIRDLPVETQQAVEIARALSGNARVLILDEPTAVLAPPGIALLFARLRRLQQSGVTIVVILHKIREVLAIAQSVAVLRSGRLVADRLDAAVMSPAALAEAIVGSAVGEPVATPPGHAVRVQRDAPAALSLDAVSTCPGADGPALENVTLRVERGEIVGIAGVEGNGQHAIVDVIAGFTGVRSGRISIGAGDVTQASLLERRRRGLRIIPFERNTEGLSLSSPLWQNWSAPALADGALLRPVDPRRLRSASRTAFDRWDVRRASVDQPASSLSGGNAQKVILAREIDAGAALIIAAQPTRGLDIEATAFVWRALRDASSRGCGVIVVSSDLDELFDSSDRIVVMLGGRIVAQFLPPYDLAAVGAAMTGAPA